MKKLILYLILSFWFSAQAQENPFDFKKMKDDLQKAAEEASMRTPEYWKTVSTQLHSHTGKFTIEGPIQTFDTRYEGIQGTPYLFDEWRKGAVLISGYETPQVALLNYDCVNDQLIFRHGDGAPASLPNEAVLSFVVEDPTQADTLRYFIVLDAGYTKPTFLQVLYSGKTLLLEHQKRVLRKADYQRAYNPGRRYDEYVDINELYIVSNGSDLQKIKLNKKSVSGHFPEKAQQLEEFFKKEKPELKSNNDLIRIIAYLDTH